MLPSFDGARHLAQLEIGVVDVYVLAFEPGSGLEVLVMRRANGTRCTGAWEVVHGHIEPGEAPEAAALREVAEEVGLPVQRLYSVACQPFYLARSSTVQVAVAFAAFVAPVSPTLGSEHDLSEWLSLDLARERLTWPRSRSTLTEIGQLLGGGDAGPVEDVLRVR
jgi:dihydroneopterin triphosphate diphosphatase